MKIIAGKLRGKTLKYPIERLRPTTDKTRGAIFNMIQANFPDLLTGALVCDIFSGAGAVGIEAFSRGAARVIFIENDRTTVKYLRENIKALEAETAIITESATEALAHLKKEKFDLIFLDPPYNMNLVEPVITKVAEYGMLARKGIIVIEHHKKEIFSIPVNTELFKRKDYNETIITILISMEAK
jgi:16S rRNA (guanine(966)-N(2))-methyltransferase RsmD